MEIDDRVLAGADNLVIKPEEFCQISLLQRVDMAAIDWEMMPVGANAGGDFADRVGLFFHGQQRDNIRDALRLNAVFRLLARPRPKDELRRHGLAQVDRVNPARIDGEGRLDRGDSGEGGLIGPDGILDQFAVVAANVEIARFAFIRAPGRVV